VTAFVFRLSFQQPDMRLRLPTVGPLGLVPHLPGQFLTIGTMLRYDCLLPVSVTSLFAIVPRYPDLLLSFVSRFRFAAWVGSHLRHRGSWSASTLNLLALLGGDRWLSQVSELSL